MSWKSLVTAGLLCVVAVPAWAAPSLIVTPSQTVNGNGDRVWTIQVVPDGTDLPSALAVELPFTHQAGSSSRPVGIVNGNADNTNGPANDTWYYNETAAGSNTILWNITGGTSGFPLSPANETQNPGDNPFTGTKTEGLYINGANLFASLGSTVFTSNAAVNTLQIVTNDGGGILHLGNAVIGQLGDLYNIAPKDYYVPGDFDGNGTVGPSDLSLLLFRFNLLYSGDPNWDGFLPANPNGIVGPADLSNLLFNFNAGVGFGGGGIAGEVVPEPASAALVLLGLMFASVRRRTR